MPVEVESSGQVNEFLRVIQRRGALILVPFALITSLGVAFAVIVPKKFVARTRVMVHAVPGAGGASVGGEQGKIATHLIRSPRRVQAVIVQDVAWPYQELSETEREDLVQRVLGNLSVETPNMGLGVKQQVVSITYADTDRSRAFEFLTAVSERWRNEVLEGTRNAKKAEFANLTNTRRSMESLEQTLSNEIAELHRANDVPPCSPDSRGERPNDPSFERLDNLRLQLSEMELEFEDLGLKFAELEKLYELMDDEVPLSETELGLDLSEQVLGHQEAIVLLRAELDYKGYKPEHTRYKQLQDEIRQLEDVIRLLEESSRVGVATEEQWLPNIDKLAAAEKLEKDRVALLRTEERIAALRVDERNLEARTKELQSVYQQLDTLDAQRERVHENLIVVGEDHNAMKREIDILTSAAGNPFTVLDEPKMPVRPTQPDPLLIILACLLGSLALGLGVALATEYSRSCFRSVNDITRVMVVPVLGTVNGIVTQGDKSRAFLARTVLGGSTVAFVAVVGFLTWAWAQRPDLLTDDIRQSIDAFRASFE